MTVSIDMDKGLKQERVNRRERRKQRVLDRAQRGLNRRGQQKGTKETKGSET
jgi:hypothetical protein